MAGKPHDAVVKFDAHLNLQRHRAVLSAIARLSCYLTNFLNSSFFSVKRFFSNLCQTIVLSAIVIFCFYILSTMMVNKDFFYKCIVAFWPVFYFFYCIMLPSWRINFFIIAGGSRLLADRTTGIMICYWHDNVCLSVWLSAVCLCIVNMALWLNVTSTAKVAEQVNRKCPRRNTILQ